MKVYGEAGPERVYILARAGPGKGLFFAYVGPGKGLFLTHWSAKGYLSHTLVQKRVSNTCSSRKGILCFRKGYI